MTTFKKKKISISIITSIFITFTIVSGIIWGDFLPAIFTAPRYNKVDKFLKTNIGELSYVTEALLKMEYNTITIRKTSTLEADKYSMKVSREYLVYETVPVPDELISHVEALYKSGVIAISSGSHSVTFSIWSNMYESRGIIYSDNGTKPDSEQLIEVRQLSENNWYYYVHNYEKAKKQNPERFN